MRLGAGLVRTGLGEPGCMRGFGKRLDAKTRQRGLYYHFQKMTRIDCQSFNQINRPAAFLALARRPLLRHKHAWT